MNLMGLTDEERKKSFALIDKAEKKGLKNIKFLPMDIKGWAQFSEVFLEYKKEISKSSNLRIIVILTTEMIEYLLDTIIGKVYLLDKRERISSYEFLSFISLRNKIEFISKLKKHYLEKRPKENGYKPGISITAGIKGFKKLEEKFGKNFFEIVDHCVDEVDREKGIVRPLWTKAYNSPPNDDYLEDDIIDLLKKIDIEILHQIGDLRNMVAHYLHYRIRMAKLLKVSESVVHARVKKICTKTLSELMGSI